MEGVVEMLKKSLFITICFVMFIGLFGLKGKASVDISELSLSNQCNYMLDFLENNLEELQKQYNQVIDKKERKMDIQFIEGYSLVKILDDNSYGIYIDFNDQQGYMLTTFKFHIYELETSGDLDYLKDIPFMYYHTADKFLYKTASGYGRYENLNQPKQQSYGANGQTGNGDGDIYDVKAYVADRYPNYTLEMSVDGIENVGKQYFIMYGLAYYIHYFMDENDYYDHEEYENNCTLTAMINMLHSWNNYGLTTKLPKYTDVVDLTPDILNLPLYDQYGRGQTGGPNSDYWTVRSYPDLQEMYVLYDAIFRKAVSVGNYTPEEGMDRYETEATLKAVLEMYGEKFDILTTDSFVTAMPDIVNLVASFIGIANSSTYGNHAVCLIGYNRYKNNTDWWVFEQTKTAYLYQINDSMGNICHFDPSRGSKCTFITSGVYTR